MAQESRVKKTLLNARVNLIFYFLTLALSFFSRKIFLDTLGADFVGLTGTLQNLLGFLNLAELGVGSAIGYLLYKPLYDHDQNKINEIISVMGYLYRWIGLIILAAGILLSFFLPLIFPSDNTGFPITLIYFAYFSFLGSSLIGYFINYRQNLLGADQRNYVVTAYFQTANIIKTLIQMVLAWYTGSYYLWVIIEFTFGIIYSFILNWKINQTYPWLRASISSGRALFRQYPEVMTKTKQLFVHKIAGFAQFQSQSFFIYMFVSLGGVAMVGNYLMIVDKLNVLLNTFLSSSGAGVGNLIAEGNKTKIMSVFWQMFSLQFFVATFIVYILYKSIDSFISIWVGEEYILSGVIVVLILIKTFLSFTRSTVDQFIFGYGLFYDVWAPLAEALIYVIVALVGGYFFGLKGVLCAGIISLIVIVELWKPYFLFRSGLKVSVWNYWNGYFKCFFFSFLSIVFCNSIIDYLVTLPATVSVIIWIKYVFIVSLIFLIVISSVYFVGNKHFRSVVGLFYQKIFLR